MKSKGYTETFAEAGSKEQNEAIRRRVSRGRLTVLTVAEYSTYRGIRMASWQPYGSHFKNLPNGIRAKLEEHQKTFTIKDVISRKFSPNMNKSIGLKAKFAEIDKVKVVNHTERAQKEVFRFILNQHVKQTRPIKCQHQDYPEEDFKLKCLSFILEEIFGYGNINLKRDTVPGSLKKSNTTSA
ncbi:hypothetical protein INT47_007438 [Mucor saturninus]|uniref:Uncharacterized protein n=1 Tax=Mucor saturninus TaxID=64648 RepID=A0A8H7UWT4_9FUNG|nr:hypothetical protein INT47_007438 [Mucor saturninus]